MVVRGMASAVGHGCTFGDDGKGIEGVREVGWAERRRPAGRLTRPKEEGDQKVLHTTHLEYFQDFPNLQNWKRRKGKERGKKKERGKRKRGRFAKIKI